MARMIRGVPQLMRNIWPSSILSSRSCSVLLHSLYAQKIVYGLSSSIPYWEILIIGVEIPLNGLTTFSEYHSISWYIIQLSFIVGSISHEISQISYPIIPHHSEITMLSVVGSCRSNYQLQLFIGDIELYIIYLIKWVVLKMGDPQVAKGFHTKSWSSMTTGWFGVAPWLWKPMETSIYIYTKKYNKWT